MVTKKQYKANLEEYLSKLDDSIKELHKVSRSIPESKPFHPAPKDLDPSDALIIGGAVESVSNVVYDLEHYLHKRLEEYKEVLETMVRKIK